VRRKAERLVRESNSARVPVPVEEIAHHLGLRVVFEDLGPEVSGLLVTKPGEGLICVQRSDAPVRKRFTIAHEVAHHYLGHQFEPGSHVHVDKGNFISQRGLSASTGMDAKEVEANQFAATLLMPGELVLSAVERIGLPLTDDKVQALAKLFKVSEQAMTIRLSVLKLL
jgi:Zn-dependent peptidase ImmA (M78 family)